MTNPWVCPNFECHHSGVLHDINEPGDQRPRCCVDDCQCGAVPVPVEPECLCGHIEDEHADDGCHGDAMDGTGETFYDRCGCSRFVARGDRP